MKMTTMPTSTQEMVTIIFKPSPPPDRSLLTLGSFTKGAMVPGRGSKKLCYRDLSGLKRDICSSLKLLLRESEAAGVCLNGDLLCSLTAVVAERCKLQFLLGIAGAVVDFHLQLVPGGLLQVVQDVALGEGGALRCGPCRRRHWPILQCERCDGASAVIPAIQVELDPSGIDAREEFLFFGVLRFYARTKAKSRKGNEGYLLLKGNENTLQGYFL